MHEVLVNRLGGLSLPRKSVVRLTDRPDMTLDVYRGRKTTIQQKKSLFLNLQVMPLCLIFPNILVRVIIQLPLGMFLCNLIGICFRSGRRVANKNDCSPFLAF